MFDVLSDLNVLAIALSTVVLAVIGGLYFVALVPRQYAIVLGREGEPAPEAGVVTYLGPVVCTLVVTVTNAVLMAALGVDALGDALAFGAIVGVGYLVSMTFNIAINPNFPRPLAYGVLNTPFFLVGNLVSCAILQTVS